MTEEKVLRKLKITSRKEITSGTSEKDGKSFTWTLYEVEATDEAGSKVEQKLKTFADLPMNELVELEVERQEHETHGVSYMLKKPRQNVSREEFNELVSRVEKLESPPEKAPEKPQDDGTQETDPMSIPF